MGPHINTSDHGTNYKCHNLIPFLLHWSAGSWLTTFGGRNSSLQELTDEEVTAATAFLPSVLLFLPSRSTLTVGGAGKSLGATAFTKQREDKLIHIEKSVNPSKCVFTLSSISPVVCATSLPLRCCEAAVSGAKVDSTWPDTNICFIFICESTYTPKTVFVHCFLIF